MAWASARADELRLYVATDGNDSWSGQEQAANPRKTDGPFATIGRARAAIAELKKAGRLDGPATVSIRAGTYFLDKSIELAEQDSGTVAAPITYQAMSGEKVRLIGGREVQAFAPVMDPSILARLSNGARKAVVQADLKAQGITDFGSMRSRGFGRRTTPAGLELFFDDQPMTLARWPNNEDVKIAAIPKDQGANDGHGGTIGNLPAGFYYDGDRPSTWKSFDDIWVHGYWAWDWANSYEAVASIDTTQRLIKTRPPYGQYGFRKGQRLHFLNVLEELDQPGEWYLDRKSGILYFWPPKPISEGRALVSIIEQPVFRLRGASNITIRNVGIECTRGNAIEITGGENNLVAGCTIRNIGDYAVIVRGGRNNGVSQCHVSNCGDGGIDLSGGDRKTLAPAAHFATGNEIHHVARWSKCYVPAIHFTGAGIRVANNLVHDHPHCAILFGGNDHLIELNEIHHVCLETGDVGAIYTGRDWTYRGNVIRHNFIHETGGVGMGSMGVYMDDCVSGTRIEGNVFWKVQRAVFLGGGRDFVVEDNIFVDCNPSVQLDGRGLDRSPVWHNMVYDHMKRRLEEMNYKQPPYSTKYPQVLELEKFYQKDQGVPPENSVVARNISLGGKWLSVGWHAKLEMLKLSDNMVDVDPHFVGRAAGDFRLKEDSPAFRVGFKAIPFERIGPKGTHTLPSPRHSGEREG